jgi:PAS domain S-box-containing protein
MNVFFQHNPLPTFLYDLPTFALVAVNEAALLQYGYSERELLSFTLPQLAVPAPEGQIELARPRTPESIGGTRFTCTHRRNDGTLFDVELVSRLIQWNSRWLGLAVAIDITAEVSAARSLQRKIDDRTATLINDQAELRALLLSLTQADHRARQQVARTLHDHVAQDIAVAKLRLEWLLTKEPHPVLAEVQTVLTDALTNTRRLIYDMVSPALDDPEDLFMAMETLVERMNRRGLQVVVKDDGKPKTLSGSLLSLIVESIQELLFNVLKHAKTDQALVQLRAIGDRLHISVVDTGPGFSGHRPGCEGNGMGLLMIRERLEAMGGQLQIKSASGKGACVGISVPFSQHEDRNSRRPYRRGDMRPRSRRGDETPTQDRNN